MRKKATFQEKNGAKYITMQLRDTEQLFLIGKFLSLIIV